MITWAPIMRSLPETETPVKSVRARINFMIGIVALYSVSYCCDCSFNFMSAFCRQ